MDDSSYGEQGSVSCATGKARRLLLLGPVSTIQSVLNCTTAKLLHQKFRTQSVGQLIKLLLLHFFSRLIHSFYALASFFSD